MKKTGLVMVFVGYMGTLWAQESLFQSNVEKFLREFPVRMEKGEATQQDFLACQNLWKLAKNEEAKRPFLLLAAQYQRKIANNPLQSMLFLLPSLLGEAETKIWEEENVEEARKNTSPKQTKGAEKRIWTPLPPVDEWKINASNAMLAIEVANCLLEEGDYSFALTIIDEIGQNYSDESRVLAAETGGDIYTRTNFPDRAVTFYTLGLTVLDTLKKTKYEPGTGNRIFYSDEQKMIKSRLEKKCAVAKKQLDMDRYGPDWVAYRDAQTAHFAKDFLNAYFLYQKVIDDYPDSIYAEASRCYRIELLTKFADTSNLEKIPDLLKNKQKQLSELRVKYLSAKKLKQAKRIDKYQIQMDELTSFLENVQNIPTGQKALEQAEKEAEWFISADETGLYRGEVMLQIGLAWLNIFLESNKAEKWLTRTNEWCNRIRDMDIQLMQLQVPQKSEIVSRPPKEERFTDDWMNIRNAEPAPGNLFNRRECSWYLTFKQKEAVLWLGLIAFARGDYSQATEIWESLYRLDEYYRHEDAHGIAWSDVKRLLWRAQSGHGTLYITPAEMKAFKDPKSRWKVLLADLELELDVREKSAAEKFSKLMKDPAIASNRDQLAYCTLAYAISMMMQGNDDELLKVWELFGPNRKFDKTLTAPRALYMFGKRFTQNDAWTEKRKMGVMALEHVVRAYPKSEYVEDAYFCRITDYMRDEETVSKALESMREYLKKYPQGRHRKMAERWINDCLEYQRTGVYWDEQEEEP